MMKVIVVFTRLLASGKLQHGRHLFKLRNRWNILGFNFTKRDALSSVYKISMIKPREKRGLNSKSLKIFVARVQPRHLRHVIKEL